MSRFKSMQSWNSTESIKNRPFQAKFPVGAILWDRQFNFSMALWSIEVFVMPWLFLQYLLHFLWKALETQYHCLHRPGTYTNMKSFEKIPFLLQEVLHLRRNSSPSCIKSLRITFSHFYVFVTTYGFLLAELFKRMLTLEDSNDKDLRKEVGLVRNCECVKRGAGL